MTWKHWAAVVLVIGAGIVVQLERPGETRPEYQPAARTLEPTDAQAEPVGPYRTIALEVTGMT